MIIVQVRMPASSFNDIPAQGGKQTFDTCDAPWSAVEDLRKIFFVALIINCVSIVGLVIQSNFQARSFSVSLLLE